MYRLIILVLLLCTFAQAKGQCFAETRKEAINAFVAKKFKMAENLFIAANTTCPDKKVPNDIEFWLKKCAAGLSVSQKQSVTSFADKLALYEDIATSEWNEGLLAVSKKKEWEIFEQNSNKEGVDTSSKEFRLKNVPRVGFINTEGDLVIPCQYLHPDFWSISVGTYRFMEGYASVMQWNPEKQEGLWGYIDKTGRTVIPFIYNAGGNFKEGVTFVSLDENFNEWILIDKKGNRVTNDIYSNQYSSFREGLMAVKLYKSNLWGFINKEYNLVIKPQYLNAGEFCDGLCNIQPQGSDLYGYINKSGEMIIPALYSKAFPFHEGKALVFDKKEHGFNSAIINTQGQIIEDYRLRPEYLFGQWDSELQECLVANYNKGLLSNALLCGKEYERRFSERSSSSNITTSVDWWFSYLTGCIYYFGGDGIAKNYAKAIEYWEKSKKSDSFYMLGTCYDDGKGVETDYSTALDLYKKCINKDKKNKYAYYRIGLLYYKGNGVEKNFQTAMAYFQQAKECGYSEATARIEECKNELRKLIQ